jgi:hypothetical protein
MINLPFISKLVAGTLIPKLVLDGFVYCKGRYNEVHLFSEPPKQKRDCTKWTKYSFDTVIRLRFKWIRYNKLHPIQKISLNALINEINANLNMHKSQRAISRIWEDKVSRNTLRDGHRNEHRK